MRARFLVLAGAVALSLAACSGSSGTTSPSGSTPSSAAKQNLQFTGAVSGTLTNATTQCEVYTAESQANFALTGSLGGQDLTLNIQIHSGYHGAGAYPVGSLLDGAGEIRLQVGSYVDASATGAGTLTINSDGKGGSLDVGLAGGEHIKGTFQCDQVPTS